MKSFDLAEAIQILERTPRVLKVFLSDLPESWILSNEGGESWSPFDIVGHLVHGEKTDWITRAQITLTDNQDKSFPPFDRFAQFNDSKGKTLPILLDEFEALRSKNIEILQEMNITEADYLKIGIHPNFGEVNLKQLLSTWVVHDLGHIRQIARVMAKQYAGEIGPWRQFLPVVNE